MMSDVNEIDEPEIDYHDDFVSTNKNGLHVASLNIHSLRNKLDFSYALLQVASLRDHVFHRFYFCLH